MTHYSDNLFAPLLGSAYADLAQPVRAFHERALPARFAGEVTIDPARGWCARLVARIMGLPMQAGTHPIVVEVLGDQRRQQWVRHFPPMPLRSMLSADAGMLSERMGPTTFRFRMENENGDLVWRLAAVRALGVPLPLAWFGGVKARESGADGRYRFDVSAALPLIGHLVAYAGWLDVD